MTATETFKEFIGNIVAQLPAIKTVIHSDGEGIDAFLSNSENEYPALCFVRPNYKHFDNGSYGYYTYFDVSMFCFAKTQITDYGTDDALARSQGDFDAAEQIVTDIAKKLNQYNRERVIPIEFSLNDWAAEPVQSMNTDAAYGYNVRFRIGLPTSNQLNG